MQKAPSLMLFEQQQLVVLQKFWRLWNIFSTNNNDISGTPSAKSFLKVLPNQIFCTD
jgi:hypothetical protein